jgi:hypothetical protein
MRAPRCIWWAVFAGLVACHSDTAPDLGRLYASGMEQARTPPVIVIPGVLGSRLRDRSSGTEIWPGSTLHLLAGSKQNLELPFNHVSLEPADDGLEASGLFEERLSTPTSTARFCKPCGERAGSFRASPASTLIRERDGITYSPTTGGRTTSQPQSVSML